MTVNQLMAAEKFEAVAVPEPEREICGAYIGDLLSWVMGRASSGNAWITIMSNINIVAVASLSDTACIILAEDVGVEQNVIDTANSKGVNILKTSMSAYETAVFLSGRI